MRTPEQIVSDLQSFRDRWWTYNGTEKSASQTFLNQLVGCYTGLDDVFAAGATFEQFGSKLARTAWASTETPSCPMASSSNRSCVYES